MAQHLRSSEPDDYPELTQHVACALCGFDWYTSCMVCGLGTAVLWCPECENVTRVHIVHDEVNQ